MAAKTAKKRPAKKDKAARAPKPKQLAITAGDGKPINQVEGHEDLIEKLETAREAQDEFKAAQERMVDAREIVKAELKSRGMTEFRSAGFEVKLEQKDKLSIKRTDDADDEDSED